MKEQPDVRPCPKCGVKTYAYTVRHQMQKLYFHPGPCKKAGY